MSAAGGLPRAVERAKLHGCDALQVFTKNASQWRGRPLPDDEVREFRDRVQAAALTPVVSHASYLINLATADAVVRERSLTAMADELDRAAALDLLGVVVHPGCYTGGSADQGLELIAAALTGLLSERGPDAPMVLLEHTAGQGTSLGATFDQIATIISLMHDDPRIGVCLDTCHLLASGYDIRSTEGYAATFQEFERVVGFEHLRLFHMNDSKRPLGSRVDRHTHIGEGCLGLEPFRWIVNDARFQGLPMLLETPKTEWKARATIEVDPLDAKNLSALRHMIVRR
jgi:deoxyribonuclease-4